MACLMLPQVHLFYFSSIQWFFKFQKYSSYLQNRNVYYCVGGPDSPPLWFSLSFHLLLFKSVGKASSWMACLCVGIVHSVQQDLPLPQWQRTTAVSTCRVCSGAVSILLSTAVLTPSSPHLIHFPPACLWAASSLLRTVWSSDAGRGPAP